MRFSRYIPLAMLVGTMLLAPVPSPSANTEMQSLQRDVAQLQDQITALQKSLLDPKTGSIPALQSAVQQAADTANKTNSSINSLNSGIMQTLQTATKGLSDQLNSVVGLSTTVNNIASDVSNLQDSLKGLQTTVNRQGQMLSDISNQVKLLQAPAAPPPSADAGSAPGVGGPPPTQGALFGNALADHDGGKFDLALTEFQQFLHLYPNDPNAIRAQYNIGDCYYSLGKLDDAVNAFDAVTEQYPKNEATWPPALYMKGMALKKQGKKVAAIASFQSVVKDFPHSEEAGQSKSQITSLGGTVTPARKTH